VGSFHFGESKRYQTRQLHQNKKDVIRACAVFLNLKNCLSVTEKCDLQSLLHLFAVCGRKHANRILRPKVGVSVVVKANVKVTTKRLAYYVGIVNRERFVRL